MSHENDLENLMLFLGGGLLVLMVVPILGLFSENPGYGVDAEASGIGSILSSVVR